MYGKLFASCFTGSMSGSGSDMFAVWAYILANAGAEGEIELNPQIIATMIGMPEEAVQAVLIKLQQPDPRSRTKEQDGKRLVKQGEFLYQIVNYSFYRAIQTRKNQRDYMRKYMKDKRDRDKAELAKNENINVF